MRLPILALLALLAGCQSAQTKAPAKPESIQFVDKPIPYYVQVDPELTKPFAIPTGKPSEAFDILSQRKIIIQRCNIRLETIGKIQGTAKP